MLPITIFLTFDYINPCAEEVSGVDLVSDVIERCIATVGDDNAGLRLKLGEIVDDAAAEERAAVFERRLVDDDMRTK